MQSTLVPDLSLAAFLLACSAPPEGENAANWLPAPKGGFYVILRMYQPRQEVLDNKWQIPELDRVP